MSKYHKDLLKFDWRKCPDGYELLTTTNGLVVKARSKSEEIYQPFECKLSLARMFANLSRSRTSKGELDREALFTFVNNFGLLEHVPLLSSPKSENVHNWLDLSLRVREVIDILDSKDRLADAKAYAFYNTLQQPLFIHAKLSQDFHQKFRILQFQPFNLFSAIWIMLSDELTNTAEKPRACAHKKCSNWFKPRKKKMFCSDYCRVTSNRDLNKRAKRKKKPHNGASTH